MEDCGLNGVRCEMITDWDLTAVLATVFIGICFIIVVKQIRSVIKSNRK